MANMYPDNVIGTMFKMLEALMYTCNLFIEHINKTPVEIAQNALDNLNVPEWLSKLLTKFIEWNMPFIADATVFDLMLGWVLIVILLIGIGKFFTNVL